MWYEAGQLFFYMMAGHALADFALQSPHHSAAKRPGNTTGIPWPVGLGCHAMIHGGVVALATGLWPLGVAEAVAHATIDYGKGRRLYGPITDQLAHVFCKIVWMIIALRAVPH